MTKKLTLNTIYMLSESDKDMDFILSIFKMRLLDIIGFRPIVEKCVNCGQKHEIMYFSLKDNGVKCKNCGKLDKGSIAISPSTLKAIKYIIWSEPKKLFSFDLSEENKKELKLVTKTYLNKCLEKEYE